MGNSVPPSRVIVILAFIAIYFVWGTTYLAIVFALDGMEPFVVSTLRYIAAGVLLLTWCKLRGYTFPKAADLKVATISGIVMLVGGSGLVVLAETYISSGQAAVVIATEPLWFVVLDRKRWTTYFSDYLIVVGLLLGFGGTAMFAFFAPEVTGAGEGNLYGTGLTLLASVLWVLGTLYYERNKTAETQSTTTITGVQLVAAGICCAVIAGLAGEWHAFSPSVVTWQAWAGLLYLIFFGSIIAYIAFTWLVTVQPPALVSTHTYVNPVVAVVFGWLIADERITSLQVLSLGVVLVGVIITAVRGKNIGH